MQRRVTDFCDFEGEVSYSKPQRVTATSDLCIYLAKDLCILVVCLGFTSTNELTAIIRISM